MISSEGTAKLTHNEGLKESNPWLAGTIAQTLADSTRTHLRWTTTSS